MIPLLKPPKSKTESVNLPENVVLKLSTRAKRLALRLDTKDRVMNLVVPTRTSLKKAETFAWQHEKWIEEKLLSLPVPILFENGAVLSLYGRNVRVRINYSDTLKSTRISLNSNDLTVKTNKIDPSSRIIRFLKKEAKDTLTNLAHEKATEISKTLNTVSIRDTKSRWGSCSHDGKISLSWRLIFAPWEAMDYVVAHEVAHLIHMNHSKEFWQLCAELSTDYSAGKKWMRDNGHELMRYG